MWVSVHALSGLALGALAPLGVGVMIVCALGFHALLDLVPHWDYTGHRRRALWASLDVGASIALVATAFLLLGLPVRSMVAAIVSALPDLDVFDALMPGRVRRRWFPSHWPNFPHGEARPAIGVPSQIAVVFGSVAALIISAT
jgi:hypothetical protein